MPRNGSGVRNNSEPTRISNAEKQETRFSLAGNEKYLHYRSSCYIFHTTDPYGLGAGPELEGFHFLRSQPIPSLSHLFVYSFCATFCHRRRGPEHQRPGCGAGKRNLMVIMINNTIYLGRFCWRILTVLVYLEEKISSESTGAPSGRKSSV